MSTLQGSSTDNSSNTYPNGVTQSAGTTTASPAVAPNDASAARAYNSGLASGGYPTNQTMAGQTYNFSFINGAGMPIDPDWDWRVRISMQPATASLFYNNPQNAIMYPLSQSKGVVFPYTPTISINHAAKYNTTQLTHSNYASYFYEGSEVQSITLSGEFSVQNIEEGQYLMAAIHFFRACTKMFFGGNDAFSGTPPPMVFLDGYGPAYLPHVPCVITNFQHTMPAEVDYVRVPVGAPLSGYAGNQINASMYGINTRLPTMSTITLTLQPVYSRNNIANNFTMQRFAAGQLITDPTGPVGGFL